MQHLVRGDLAGSRAWAVKAQGLAPNDAATKLLAGESFIRGNVKEAIREIEAARTVDPDLKRADGALARAYLDAGRFGSAAKVLDARLKKDPKNVEILLVTKVVKKEVIDLSDTMDLLARVVHRQDHRLEEIKRMLTERGNESDSTNSNTTIAEKAEEEATNMSFVNKRLITSGEINVLSSHLLNSFMYNAETQELREIEPNSQERVTEKVLQQLQ